MIEVLPENGICGIKGHGKYQKNMTTYLYNIVLPLQGIGTSSSPNPFLQLDDDKNQKAVADN